MTITSTEISHARRRRRGRAKPRSSARAAAPSRLAQSARAPHDRAREAGLASAMAGVATLHASFAELGVPGPLVDALARTGLTVARMPGRTPGSREYDGHDMALSRKVVVDVCDREDARISTMGV